ncbi:MAG: hypothetical protein KBC84_04460, partial [Proteobacteria bacterium]|nr:hypothetical protein [Pseudomonadota bacterium]
MKISYLFFFLSITSCSFVGFYQEANPQVSGLLINISNAYFTSLAKKDFSRAEQFVIWGDYAGGNISKEQFFQSANEMVSQTETSELPFMGL